MNSEVGMRTEIVTINGYLSVPDLIAKFEKEGWPRYVFMRRPNYNYLIQKVARTSWISWHVHIAPMNDLIEVGLMVGRTIVLPLDEEPYELDLRGVIG